MAILHDALLRPKMAAVRLFSVQDLRRIRKRDVDKDLDIFFKVSKKNRHKKIRFNPTMV